MNTIKKLDSQIKSNNKLYIYAGKKELADLAKVLIYTRVHSHVNMIPSATLDFSIPYQDKSDFDKISDLSYCKVGSELTIKIDDAGERKTIFIGLIVSKELNIEDNYVSYSLTLRHGIIKLDSAIRSQVFIDKTDGEIIQSLCSSEGISIEKKSSMDVKHEQLIQFRCSDWQVLRYCLELNSAWIIAEPDRVRVISPSVGTADHTFHAQNGKMLEKAKWRLGSYEKPSSIEFCGWDVKNSKTFSVKAETKKLFNGPLIEEGGRALCKQPLKIGFGIHPSVKYLRNNADALLHKYNLSSVYGEFSALGSTSYKLGHTLRLTGFGHDVDGFGVITSLSHTITPSKWTTAITIGEQKLTTTKVPSLPTINGLQPGIVASYATKDPQGIYRIKVSLPILNAPEDKGMIWARFSMPYASTGRSFICYPEPGDEVIVSFYEGNPGYAVIVGAVHNPSRPPAIMAGQDEGMKGWKSNDAQMQMNVQSNSIHLNVADKATVTLSESHSIDIKTKDVVELHGDKGVTIKGKEINLMK
ncbi:phage baseplate assembly protein V [Aeromonas jandaei]|uniref:phage baseplate assembly protein V n=1 Tax=Aeromonas jandaei TaxID=650 RepID=UPI003BA3AE1D